MAAVSLRHLALSVLLAGGGAIAIHVTGCGLSTEGVPSDGCKLDFDCAPPHTCQLGTCTPGGQCAFVPVADGPPLVQIPGDCKRVTCVGGEPDDSIDATDSDDGNPCTQDGCAADGTPSHEPVLDGTACDAGTCQGGTCVVPCDGSTDCPKKPCKTAACDLDKGECAYTNENDGAAVSNDLDDDCQETVCLSGAETPIPADYETPTKKACKSGTCVNGTPIWMDLPNDAQDELCNGQLKCDGMGKCVGCSDVADCPGDPDCTVKQCVQRTCVVDNVPFDKGAPPQTPGEWCKKQTCDGNGGIVTVDDNGDTPPDMPNDCKYSQCSGGNPSYPPNPADTCSSCGSADGTCACTQTGECKDCVDVTTCAVPGTCETVACVANMCSYDLVPAGMPAPSNECPPGPDSCGYDGTCDGNGGCTFPPEASLCAPADCSCSAGVVCSATGAGYCTFGTCVIPSEVGCGNYQCNVQLTACLTNCASQADCVLGFVCAAGHCKEPNGSPCAGPGECASNNCVDNTCCQQASCGSCKSCNNGLGGTCTNDPFMTPCGANMACDSSGMCKLANGQSCTTGGQCASNNCCGGPKACTASSC